MSVSSHSSSSGDPKERTGSGSPGLKARKAKLELERRKTMELMEPGEKVAMKKSVMLAQGWWVC